AQGIGDASLLARYTVFSHHTLDATTLVALVAGIKFPTGSTNQHNDEGEHLDAHLQLGTGSLDALVGFSVDHAIDRWSFSANALASLPGQGEVGDESHRFGNALNYDVTAKVRVRPADGAQSAHALFLSLGVNGDLRAREHLDGNRVPDSGGHTIYLSPGVQF